MITTAVIVGVDTHADTHHAAVIDEHGRRLRDCGFPTTPAGYLELIAFIAAEKVLAVGVEGTGTYGAGLTRALHAHGLHVVEVNRPNRQHRRLRGKSDPIDAYEAAHAVLAERAISVPKRRDGLVEAMRVIRAARTSAVKARTQLQVQLKSLLVSAPEEVREKYRHLGDQARIRAIASSRPRTDVRAASTATVVALRRLAKRYQYLTDEIRDADVELSALVNEIAPHVVQIRGVGTAVACQLLLTLGDNADRVGTEAQFAALTGVAPIPASSGKTNRHRLSRAGDRQANVAIHHVALSRMAHDPATRDYVARRVAEGKSKREVVRILKRYIARELYKALRTAPAPEGVSTTTALTA